jgi:aryl-alcohol dehydrogenase-like predicted oxidoreductase
VVTGNTLALTASPLLSLSPASICLGTADLGSTVDRKDSYALLDAYLELGGNFIDTAKIYADWRPGERSASEKLLGEWMHLRRSRPRIILATKGAHPDFASIGVPRLSRPEIESDLDASLSHLQTDRIDFYWLHRDDPARPVEDILITLNEAVRAGKIRYFGCSNWRVERIRLANAYAAVHGLQGFTANQPMWNMAVINGQAIGDPTVAVMDEELWNYHRHTQLPAIPYSATANGLFQKLEKGIYSSLSASQQNVYRQPENQARFERARQVAASRGLTITQVVLGYLLSQPFPTYPIVGPKTLDQLHDCLTAMHVHLEDSEISHIKSD